MNPFYRLAPFIQEFIYRSGWNELRDVQAEAIRVILDTDSHVLITSGTASGKTEAAFFPILSALCEDPPESFGVLYIGPLKALINDQFARIEALIEETELPVYAWHGDRPASEKARASKTPKGILQITPESLEALLMNHREQARAMFAGLRFAVVDELHAFMGADRGLQLQCLLTRLDRLIGRGARRIGLSATIQDAEAAGRWLAAGSGRTTAIVSSASAGRQLNLSLRHDALPADENSPEYQQIMDERRRYLYKQAAGQKSLIFTNSRMEAENTAAALSEIASQSGEADIFRVHHGSISAAMRGETEASLRESDKPAAVVTTMTLEMGIDLGGLDKVIQLGAPNTCSSFVQRLGRSGRRGAPAVMRFLTADQKNDVPMDELPWELLQNIAIIQLYIEERWVEGFAEKPLPLSVLFHQTLSHLMGCECSGRELAKAMLTLPPFQNIPPADYRALLDHMIESDMIEKTESGTLIPGLAGEKLAGNYRFYSVFQDNEGYRVLYRQQFLGEIDTPPDVGKNITLGGRVWVVETIDREKRAVYVAPHRGKVKNQWNGGYAALDDRIVQKMRDILLSDETYPYLLPQAQESLAAARKEAQAYDLGGNYTAIDERHFLLHPWLGSKKLSTIYFLLRNLLGDALNVNRVQQLPPAGLLIATGDAPEAWLRRFAEEMARLAPEDALSCVGGAPQDRYDAFLPDALRRKAAVYNGLDIEGVKRWCGTIGTQQN